MRPSFIYHQIHAYFDMVGTIMTLYYFHATWNNFNLRDAIIIILLLSLVFGVHALVHFKEEINFDFNPMVGKSSVLDEPVRS